MMAALLDWLLPLLGRLAGFVVWNVVEGVVFGVVGGWWSRFRHRALLAELEEQAEQGRWLELAAAYAEFEDDAHRLLVLDLLTAEGVEQVPQLVTTALTDGNAWSAMAAWAVVKRTKVCPPAVFEAAQAVEEHGSQWQRGAASKILRQ